MSHSTGVEDVYEAIYGESERTRAYLGPPREHARWINEQLTIAASQYPFMKGRTNRDYFRWTSRRTQKLIDASKIKETFTAEQFWDAAYEYGSSNVDSTEPSTLHKILTSGKLEPLVLGKLYGKYIVKLLPAIGALTAFDTEFESPLDFAATNSAAIFYPDGHPSEDQVFRLPKQLSPSSRTAKIPASIHPAQDDKLRRFASLGWVIQEVPRDNKSNTQEEWRKTGFVLVIDMDDRNIRHRHPWFVLAPEWPTDGYKAADGTFTHHTPQSSNRIPLGQIVPMEETDRKKIVLKQFGEDFNFGLERHEGHRRSWPSNKGPDLAEVMDWYWDPVAEREVCFRKGMEYMRFNRTTMSYEFPNFWNTKIARLNGFFGCLEEDCELEAGELETPESSSRSDRTLEADMGGLSMATKYPPERRRRIQTNP